MLNEADHQLAKKRKENDKKKAATPSASIAPSSPASTVAETLPSTRTSVDEPRPELDGRLKSPLIEGDAGDKTRDDVEETNKKKGDKGEEATPGAEVVKAETEADEVTALEAEPLPVAESKPPAEPVAAEASTPVQEPSAIQAPIAEEASEGIVSPITDSRRKDKSEAAQKADEENAKLQETISNLLAERSDLQDQISKLQRSLQSAEAESKLLEEGRALITKLEGEKSDLETKLTGLEERATKADTLQGQVEELEKKLDVLRNERDELKRAAEEIEESREKELGEVKEKADELEKSLSRAREREGGLEAEVGRLRSVRLRL